MRFYFNSISESRIESWIALGEKELWLDMEVYGKKERQPGNNRISNITIEDVKHLVSKYHRELDFIVRIDPLHKNSESQIKVLESIGVSSFMLPMFRSKEDVLRIKSFMHERSELILLFETVEAIISIDSILSLGVASRVHLGINDLHKQLGLKFMFEVFSLGITDRFAISCKEAGIQDYGIGGIASLEGGLIPGRMVLIELLRLGCTSVIISRSLESIECDKAFAYEIKRIYDLQNGEYNVDDNRKSLLHLISSF